MYGSNGNKVNSDPLLLGHLGELCNNHQFCKHGPRRDRISARTDYKRLVFDVKYLVGGIIGGGVISLSPYCD